MRSWWPVIAVVVGAAALATRLVVAGRSGGLVSIDTYDAAVYFGSAVALIHGEVPYRDFLLLHPPGGTLAYAPFAALSLVTTEGTSWAVARVAVMAVGTASAVLVARLLHPLGSVPALAGGLAYAVLLPAVTTEVTTRLEPLAGAALLAALVLLARDRPWTQLGSVSAAAAGALLAAAALVKIWGAVPLLVVAMVVAASAGWRRLAAYGAGAAVVGLAVGLPFLLLAGGDMWRQVVSDQFGRPRSRTSNLERMADVVGLGPVWDELDQVAFPLVVAALVVATLATVASLRVPRLWLSGVLLVVFVGMLLATPTWFPHYASLASGVLAVVVGAGVAALRDLVGSGAWRAAVAAVAAGGLVGLAGQLPRVEVGERFPADRLAAAVAPLPGCVTADDPGALLGMDVVGRNLDRGCPLVLDPGGYSYHFRPSRRREDDLRWQRFFLDYLGGGSAALKTRYSVRFGLSRATAREIRRWPVLVEVDGLELRRPPR